MTDPKRSHRWLHWLVEYSNIIVLLLLCGCFSVLTWKKQHPTDVGAAQRLSRELAAQVDPDDRILVVTQDIAVDRSFTAAVVETLTQEGIQRITVVNGEPPDAGRAIRQSLENDDPPSVIVCTNTTAAWGVIRKVPERDPRLKDTQIRTPQPYFFPDFLKTDNLLNIADQIAVIAIIAAGMTMVIITGGIDLSVGSLIALSAVVAAVLIRDAAGGESASVPGMVAACLASILLCTCCGVFSGVMVTRFHIPPFIVTLAIMMVASGAAYMLANGESIDQIPDSFVWLGRGDDLMGIPNAVVLTLLLYGLCHAVMSRMTLGRYIYAVGGNAEAARLSGVPVRKVIVFVYAACGALAGLGGVVMASQLNSGAPTYGVMYELFVIAAVVVGGTSLSGGEGRVMGTLIGALDIAVIRNGMNLMGVDSYMQKVVLGLVILAAVLLDRGKQMLVRS